MTSTGLLMEGLGSLQHVFHNALNATVVESTHCESGDNAYGSWGLGREVSRLWNVLLLSEASGYRLCRPAGRSPRLSNALDMDMILSVVRPPIADPQRA